jgi:predicted RNase H-like HicB family nuclease
LRRDARDLIMNLSTRLISETTGASLRQLGYWAKTGLLAPGGSRHAGRSRRYYTFQDVVAAMTIVQLRKQECPLQKIRLAIQYLRQHFPDESNSAKLSRLTLMTDGKKVYILNNEREIFDVVSRQHVWSIALGMLVRNARQRMEALPLEWVQPVRVERKLFHLVVNRDPENAEFIVQCRELPGAMEQGKTAEEAIANGKDAIESVLKFMKRRHHHSEASHVKAG